MRLLETLSHGAVFVALTLIVACTANPSQPELVTPELIQITAVPASRVEHPAGIVITPEPGTSAPDPRFFLTVTVVDAAWNLHPAMMTLEFPASGGAFEIGPTPSQLFPIPIAGEEHFIVRASAEGYQPVQQEFRVSLTADAEYELVLVLQPAPAPTPSAPEA